jgi:ssRNA-specific RNase YbeY (16S rRNA maturation enzyme)
MKIWIRNRQKHIPLDLRKIRRAAQRILAELGFLEAELSLLFVNDRQIQTLNRKYLRRDKPTNVLAFSMREGEFSTLHPHLLGDLVISVETARRQSNRSALTKWNDYPPDGPWRASLAAPSMRDKKRLGDDLKQKNSQKVIKPEYWNNGKEV